MSQESFTAEFLNLSSTDTLGQITLGCGSCPADYRMRSSIPGLYSLNASSTSTLYITSSDDQKCL